MQGRHGVKYYWEVLMSSCCSEVTPSRGFVEVEFPCICCTGKELFVKDEADGVSLFSPFASPWRRG